jgi:hypothetical protein
MSTHYLLFVLTLSTNYVLNPVLPLVCCVEGSLKVKLNYMDSHRNKLN